MSSIDELVGRNKEFIEKCSEDCVTYFKDGTTNVFYWQQEIFGFQNGLYQPKGRLNIPIRCDDDIQTIGGPEQGVIYKFPFKVFTVFSEKFFQEEGTISEGWETDIASEICDWRDSSPNTYILLSRGSMLSSALSAHIEGYFKLRKKLLKGAIPEIAEEEKNLILRCFAEYGKCCNTNETNNVVFEKARNIYDQWRKEGKSI